MSLPGRTSGCSAQVSMIVGYHKDWQRIPLLLSRLNGRQHVLHAATDSLVTASDGCAVGLFESQHFEPVLVFEPLLHAQQNWITDACTRSSGKAKLDTLLAGNTGC